MINNFKNIGEILLEKDGFYRTEDLIEKRRILLHHQALKPYIKKNKQGNDILDGKAICLNFDLNNNQIDFRLSNKDLHESHKDDFFAFRCVANVRKKFLSTNRLDPFLSSLFIQSIDYIKKGRTQKKSKSWFKENISGEYENLMNHIFQRFYVKDKKEVVLDYTKLIPDQKEIFEQIKTDLDDKAEKQKNNALYNSFLNIMFQ